MGASSRVFIDGAHEARQLGEQLDLESILELGPWDLLMMSWLWSLRERPELWVIGC